LAGLRTQLKDSDSSVILDLEEVRLVDAEVVRFLAECESDGVKIRNCSAYIREWMRREREKSELDI